MADFLNDNFNRSGYFIGNTASTTGSTWSSFSTQNGGGTDQQCNGSAFVAGGLEIVSYLNAATASGLAVTSTITFTPTADNWVCGIYLHGDSDGYPSWAAFAQPDRRRIVRITGSSDSVETNVVATLSDTSIAAANRSSHTIEFNIAANGDMTMKVDGSTVSFGTVNDANLTTAGRAGMFVRAVNVDSIAAANAVTQSQAPRSMHQYRMRQTQ